MRTRLEKANTDLDELILSSIFLLLVQVLHGIDGNLEVGEMLAVIGPSGSGKSCLLDILAERKTVGKFSGLRLLDGEVGKPGTKIAGERNAMSACQIWDYNNVSLRSLYLQPILGLHYLRLTSLSRSFISLFLTPH